MLVIATLLRIPSSLIWAGTHTQHTNYMPIAELSRRTFLHSVAAATALSASGFAQEPGRKINQIDEVQLPQVHGPSEQNEKLLAHSFLWTSASVSRSSV